MQLGHRQCLHYSSVVQQKEIYQEQRLVPRIHYSLYRCCKGYASGQLPSPAGSHGQKPSGAGARQAAPGALFSFTAG